MLQVIPVPKAFSSPDRFAVTQPWHNILWHRLGVNRNSRGTRRCITREPEHKLTGLASG